MKKYLQLDKKITFGKVDKKGSVNSYVADFSPSLVKLDMY